jgi:hypothetical protein
MAWIPSNLNHASHTVRQACTGREVVRELEVNCEVRDGKVEYGVAKISLPLSKRRVKFFLHLYLDVVATQI